MQLHAAFYSISMAAGAASAPSAEYRMYWGFSKFPSIDRRNAPKKPMRTLREQPISMHSYYYADSQKKSMKTEHCGEQRGSEGVM